MWKWHYIVFATSIRYWKYCTSQRGFITWACLTIALEGPLQVPRPLANPCRSLLSRVLGLVKLEDKVCRIKNRFILTCNQNIKYSSKGCVAFAQYKNRLKRREAYRWILMSFMWQSSSTGLSLWAHLRIFWFFSRYQGFARSTHCHGTCWRN